MKNFQNSIFLICLIIFLSSTIVQCSPFPNWLTSSPCIHNEKQQNTFYTEQENADRSLYFSQIIDHNVPGNRSGTYQQRYFQNTTFFNQNDPNAPVFIFLGGEADLSFFDFQTVQILNWCGQFKAKYLALEHRYYGKSLPHSVFSTENLSGTLNSQQALADAAFFIQEMKANDPHPNRPWVVWGCSYSAALSAWFREKYPNLVVGSVAPSGPVEAKLNFTGYFGLFEKVAPAQCVSSVQKASNQIYQMAQTEQGRAQLSETFHCCPALSQHNLVYFLSNVQGAIGSADQFDNPPAVAGPWPLNETCDQLLANTNQGNNVNAVIENWAEIARGGQNSCMLIDEALTRKTIGLPIASSSRAWFWQKCVEFGFFKPTYQGTSIFFPDVNLPWLLSYCQDAFGIANMSPDVTWTNTYYGGKNLISSQTLFTNGLIDPWHLVSINQDLSSPSSVKAVTYNAGHCAVLVEATPNDPPSLIAARKAIYAFLSDLLKR